MNIHEKINYIEFPAKDFDATKDFFSTVFGWVFVDYGPEYMSFDEQGFAGGFYLSDLNSSKEQGAALVVFFSDDLLYTQSKIESAGGTINIAIFEFPGGQRFHFYDPNGNEFAVWSDQNVR
ncbi:MAG: putative enzyme related to lactoylglutathione lyase [Enterobacterales bacterium]|jgi:predicted enzyme related to lactoylglutathione lyase